MKKGESSRIDNPPGRNDPCPCGSGKSDEFHSTRMCTTEPLVLLPDAIRYGAGEIFNRR
ncbi:SEC-C domain-containing protein [candidate division WOR-3 bacterium]|nr:SEC-C domain-containing protein [candidate division WOR-3 bacterium]